MNGWSDAQSQLRICDRLDPAAARAVPAEPDRGLADSDPAMTTEFAALAGRVPDGTICLGSGLSYWELSDELPAGIDLAVPRGAHWPKIDMPATRLRRFAAETFGLDRLAAHTAAGGPFWIYSASRCIVDAMRLPHVVGRDVAFDPRMSDDTVERTQQTATRIYRQIQALACTDYGGPSGRVACPRRQRSVHR